MYQGAELSGSTRITQPSHQIIDVAELKSGAAELKLSSCSYIFQGLIKILLTSVMVLVVSRGLNLTLSFTFGKSRNSKQISARVPSPPVAPSSDYKWILFLKASPDFLKTCSSLLKFTQGVFQRKAVLFFSAPSFWSVLFVSIAVSLCGFVPPMLSTCHPHHTHFNQAPQMNGGQTFHWPHVKSKLFRVSLLEKICQLVYWPP